MNGYYIEVIGPDIVRIHEDVASYAMTKQQAAENLQVVKASRAKYDSDDAYLRRVNFYENILEAMNGGIQ